MKRAVPFLIIGVALFLNFNKANTSKKTDISLLNIKAMQASASEARCAPVIQYYCKITLPNGTSIEGYGLPQYF